MRALIGLLAAAVLVAGCTREKPAPVTSSMQNVRLSMTPFGGTADNQPIDLYTLRNPNGVEIRVMTYGGTILSINTPDRNGQGGDIVLGHDTAAEYFKNPNYFGVIAGRYANRIAN